MGFGCETKFKTNSTKNEQQRISSKRGGGRIGGLSSMWTNKNYKK